MLRKPTIMSTYYNRTLLFCLCNRGSVAFNEMRFGRCEQSITLSKSREDNMVDSLYFTSNLSVKLAAIAVIGFLNSTSALTTAMHWQASHRLLLLFDRGLPKFSAGAMALDSGPVPSFLNGEWSAVDSSCVQRHRGLFLGRR